ncbi:hypothetical protein MAPG_05682 [Magnaporthiopsis poae ATCC 64411]|uniref:Uncharacterized protein n=1 Tax=Magnaporthiopsis poae (strain ATCC 64411 / 73-15) TaxID=644358 RepID=A0A0C4E016_MAGP6|nr:hypothetical protein MAPG_05682 [Magnaporthiopsis poae ATCC 64411]
MAAAVDLDYLSSHLSLPPDTIATVATDPTADLVSAILNAVAIKAREFDVLYSEKLQLGIELENAVRSSESRCQTFKATTDNALKEVEDLRRKLQEEETSRQTTENQLQFIKSETTTLASQVETLRARTTSLEATKRDTLAILDTKNAANAELSEELQKQHQKNLALSQELSQVQQEVQAAKTVVNSAKFREQSLRQELEFAQKNNEWLETELKTKTADALKDRKEKGERIAELQRLNDEANSTVDSLTKSEQQLRSRLDAAQKKTEEALTKIQQLQEAAARSDAGYKQEVDTAKRLAEVSQEYAEQYKKEMSQIKLNLEQVKDNSADELRKVLQQLEQAREECTQLEQKEQQLQAEVDQLRAMTASHGHDAAPGSAPQTPKPNGALFRAASPFGTPGSLRVKSSITATQAMEELYRVKGELAGEKRRNRNLTQELDEMMNALEAKGPELSELQEEAERLRHENVQMTRIADESFQERDLAKKSARKAEAALNTSQAEIRLLRAQMRDLSTQVQVLIFNMHAREKGLDQLTDEEVDHFAKLQRGEVSENSLNDMSDTHVFITEKFVAFKDIAELQEKNQELLRVTRDLADKFENEEAMAAKRQAAEDQEEVLKLRDLVSKLQEESKSLTTRMKSYMTERDMFRRMLQQKASAGEINSVLGNSVDGREVLASIEQTSPDDHDLSAALRELQANFDAYRNEQGVDLQAAREQAKRLSEEKSALQGEVARLNSQLALVNERYEILQVTNADLESQKDHLKKRNQDLSQNAAKTEALAQSRAEDLIETKGLLESMRAENSNLKAEKALWKSIQERLIKDNEDLGEEKTRLGNLLASHQSLQNERQLSESESKRRLQAQIDNLESELNSTKRKLADEVEEAKKLQLRKDYDSQQAQKRIDDLMASLGQHKEELVAIKTSRDHLQARVNELTAELRSAEERAQRLQPQPTSRAQPSTATGEESEDLEARIQELTDEAVDLRRELEIANARLENAKAEADQFRELASTIEEDLRSLESAQEAYRQEMDAAISSRDSTIKELEQRISDMSAELSTTNTELSTLRDSQAETHRRFEDEKRILDSEITRLRDQEATYKEKAKHHQANLRSQCEITAKAQQDYEQELLKHAEAAKQVQKLRAEQDMLKSEAAKWRADAESAKVSLAQGQSSWEERAKQMEQELVELRARREDANAQNKLLHQQIENVTTQISDLQQSRSFGDDAAATAPLSSDTAIEGLRELNSYLRKEKEILEYQYELKLQDSKRLQQQVNYLQSQLDEARLKLEQERRAQSETGSSSRAYAELMDKVNEMNVVRESNVTLRNEVQHAQRQLTIKNKTVQELREKLQPLEARLAEVENQNLFLQEEVKQLQEDRDRWQERTNSILTKYGRVDPAELEQFKQTVTDLEAQRDALAQSEESLKAQIAALEAKHEAEMAALAAKHEATANNWKENRQKLVEQAKDKSRQQTLKINALQTEKKSVEDELKDASDNLAAVQAQLETAKQEKAAVEDRLQATQQQLQQQAQNAATTEQVAPTTSASSAMAVDDGRMSQLEQELANVRQELQATFALKAATEQEVASLREQLSAAIEDRDRLQALAQSRENGEPKVANGNEPAKARSSSAAGAVGLSEAEAAVLRQQISAAEAKAEQAEKKAAEVEANIKVTLDQRSNKMKEALNQRLKDSKENMAKELEEEKTKLKQEYDLRLEQERKIWLLENSAPATAATSDSAPAPATPVKPEQTPSTPVVDMSKLSDADVRRLLTENATIKAIIASNIRKRIEENKKIRDEEEQVRVAQVKEQATMMAEKKSALRINMLDNKFKLATGKLGVVETAAKETPERPVAEVWEVACQYKPPPPAPAAAPPQQVGMTAPGTPVAGTPTASSAAPPSAAVPPASRPAQPTPATPTAAASTPVAPGVTGTPAPKSLPMKPQPAVSAAAPVHNPFAQNANANTNGPAKVNPFAAQVPQPAAAPAAAQQQSQLQQPAARTGIPVPSGRGGNAQRGGRGAGVYQAPNTRGGGQAGRGGRGGAQRNPSAASLNPGANDFQPGNKRPRNEETGGGGPGGKRQRGGAGGGAPGGGNAAA